MAVVLNGFLVLLLTGWTSGQATDPPPAVDLINGGGDVTFERRNGENVASDIGTSNQGQSDAFVGVNTNTNTGGGDPLADLNAAINTGGTTSIQGGGGILTTGGTGSDVNTNIQIDPLLSTGGGLTNTGNDVTLVNQGGTNIVDSGIGGATVGGNNIVVSNTGINTGSFGGNTGLNNQNTNLNTGRTTVVNSGGTIGNSGRTSVVNVGGTIGNTGGTRVQNNVKTATSGGTVKVASRDGLSASAQNRRPRLPDVTHAECIQSCQNSQYKSSHHCLFASTSDCQKFVICYKHGGMWFGYSYYCPFGKFWYNHACVGFADYQCNFDMCSVDPSLRSYRDKSLQYVDPNLNCRTYWQCQNGKSFPYCCPNGQAYREGVGCVDDNTCHDWCCPTNQIFVEGVGCREMPHQICFEKCCPADVHYGSCLADSICLDDCVRDLNHQVTNCPLSPVPGDNKKFSINDNGQIYQMPCGHGTIYMQEKCACVPGSGDPSAGFDCRPTVHVDFNNDTVKNSQQAHVYFHNITSTKNFGKFGRGSRAEIGFYRGNAGVLYNMFIELRFYDSNRYSNGRLVGPDVQVLVSNCRIRNNNELSPSIAIVMLPATQTLTFVGITDTESATFKIPYDRKSWNNVLLRYDGSELYGEVTYQESSGQKLLKTNRESRPLGGKLKTSSVEALSIGSCGSSDYFEGYMDEIWIFDCIPQTQQFPSANAV